MAKGQAPLIFDHDYPVILEEQPEIRTLMDRVSTDSLESTLSHLTSYYTRMWNSKMVYEVQDWLANRYAEMDFDSVYLHDFLVFHHDSLFETSDNVIALKRGLVHPDEYVVCGAHYDSYNNSPGLPDSLRAPGADDNATGVAGIMEAARLLSHCHFERSVLFCNWAAEEVGLKGSEAFANECAEHLVDIVGYFNLDMTGYLKEGTDLHVHLLYTTRDSLIANYVYNFCDVYYPDMPVRQNWLPWGDSDYSSFNRAGYAAIHPFEDVYFSSPYIHSSNDILGVSVNNMPQCKRFTELNLGLVATLAGLITTSVDEEAVEHLTVYPNPVSETLFFKGVSMQKVDIFDLLGQQVASRSFEGEECGIDVGFLVPGIYFVRVLTADGSLFTKKMVKE